MRPNAQPHPMDLPHGPAGTEGKSITHAAGEHVEAAFLGAKPGPGLADGRYVKRGPTQTFRPEHVIDEG